MKTNEIFAIVEMVLGIVEAFPTILEEVKHCAAEFSNAEDDKAKADVVIAGLENVLTIIKSKI